MFHSPYLRCPACGILVCDPTFDLVRVDNPAPCCGAHGESRSIWPGLQAIKLLEIAQDQDQESPEGQRISVLFLASALELMLEDVLVELLQQHTNSEALREAVLDAHQGVERRRTLFTKLNRASLGEVLAEQWGKEFLQDWKTLAERRNKIAHGKYYYRDSNDLELVRRISSGLLRAFVEVHNHVTRQMAVDSACGPTQ